MEFPERRKKTSGSVPFGYKLTDDGSELIAVPHQIELLEETVNGLLYGKIASLREAKEIIDNSYEDATISHQTISKYVKKEKIELGLVDPNKPSRGYNYHSKTKAKIAAQKSIREKKKREKTLEKKLRSVRTSLKKQTSLQKSLMNQPTLKPQKGR